MSELNPYAITEAAEDMEGLLASWRQRVGVFNSEAIDEITGTSFTWKDNGSTWTFTYSMRRGSQWFKMTHTVELPSEEVEAGLDIESPTRFDLVMAGSEVLLNQMMLDVFPDVTDALLGKPCKKHPTYKALRHPRTDCEDCWQFFRDRNPGKVS